ncbi:MAG: Mur ligase family protein [Candidatus Gottesmanbacteria bacterium]|nr:Mur ligase family protein [Candidatus Gottesmanbacteria bacterium]
MNLRTRVAIIFGKLVSILSKTFALGAGATWPGEIALRIQPRILRILSANLPHIILVAGTNGKTTTVKMIETILTQTGKTVQRNASGANLDNGIVSAFLADMKAKYYIFEVDEATLPNVLKDLTPEIIVLTNLFRDQLDRYGEVDTIAEKWLVALGGIELQTNVIVNADDPHLAFIGSKISAQVKYFGLEDPSLFLPKMQHATDTIYCPNCGARLTFAGVYFSHLGKWACGNCSFVPPKEDVTASDFVSPLEGIYNKYNTLAAALTAQTLGVTKSDIREALTHFTPAFGRMERIGRNIILLSKNPTGFNESLRTVAASKEKGPVLFVLNDRIPDGRDVSWIWDVDFEEYRDFPKYYVSGDRALDMALRLKYAGIQSTIVKDIPQEDMLWILPTYSAMLDIRKKLTGRKIL